MGPSSLVRSLLAAIGIALLCSSAGMTAPNVLRAQLEPVVRAEMTQLGIPGAIIGVWRGGSSWTAALGVADLRTRKPIAFDERMRIGSITKTFTGTLVLQLVDQHRMRLDDPVSKYYPGVPNGDHITIRELGDMTSGLFNYSDDTSLLRTMDADPERSWAPEQLLRIGLRHKPYFAPGKGWHYSNTNTVLLGLILERNTATPIVEQYRRRIWAPLQMEQTSFPATGAMPEPHTRGYYFGTNENPKVPPGTPPRDVTNDNPSWTWAAGQMVSTLADLHRYAKPLATGTLLTPATQRERLRWRPVGKDGLKYGFAIFDVGGALGHNGELPGYQSFMGYDPRSDTEVIILTNLALTRDGKPTADELAKTILARLHKS